MWNRCRSLLGVIALSVAATGCKSLPSATEVLGATVGGATCAAIAYGQTGSKNTALAWAAACAAAGYAVTKKLEKKRREYASEEAFFHAETARLNREQQAVLAENQRLQESIQEDETRLAALRRAPKSTARRTDVEVLNASVKQRRSTLSDQLEKAKTLRDEQKALLAMQKKSGQPSAEGEKQLQDLEARVAELDNMLLDNEVQSVSAEALL